MLEEKKSADVCLSVCLPGVWLSELFRTHLVGAGSVSQNQSCLQLCKHLDSLHQTPEPAELAGSAKFIWML